VKELQESVVPELASLKIELGAELQQKMKMGVELQVCRFLCKAKIGWRRCWSCVKRMKLKKAKVACSKVELCEFQYSRIVWYLPGDGEVWRVRFLQHSY